ncbi:MAG: hypothetical protein HQM09_23805, partial [Candidatus Riflebacteria bacterium]|nr:hypothetical protein [Candidatus Riflebacteria bacterium]
MSFILEKGTIFYQGKFQPLSRLVIDGSKITEVTLASGKAKKPKPPAGKHKGDNHEKIIDCQGKYILPGFIDAHTHLSLEEEGIGWIDQDMNESFGMITPQVRAFDALKMRDRAFKDAL